MKKTLLLLANMLLVVTLLRAQTADDIINKYIDAIGGKGKLTNLKTLYMEGSMDANGQKIVIKTWAIDKKAMRFEMQINGMTLYQIITSDSGWSFNPFMGQKQAEPMTSDQVKMGQPNLDVAGTLVNYKDKGYKVTYEGKDDVDGTEAYKIEEIINDSLSTTFYIDPDTYYILRSTDKAKVNGKEVDGKTDYSNYQKTPEGYVFPMEINSDGGDMKFTLVKVNTDIANTVFSHSN